MKSAIDCKHPMVAIASLEHAGVEYAPGEEFDADTDDARQFHLIHATARDHDSVTRTQTPPPPQTAAPEIMVQPTTKVQNGKSAKRLDRNR